MLPAGSRVTCMIFEYAGHVVLGVESILCRSCTTSYNCKLWSRSWSIEVCNALRLFRMDYAVLEELPGTFAPLKCSAHPRFWRITINTWYMNSSCVVVYQEFIQTVRGYAWYYLLIFQQFDILYYINRYIWYRITRVDIAVDIVHQQLKGLCGMCF